MPYQIREAVQEFGYAAGDAGGIDFGSSKRMLTEDTVLFLIFKPLRGWRRFTLLEPWCIGLLDITKGEWKLYVYGLEYQREMRDFAALLGNRFKVNIETMLRSEKPRNW